MPDQDWVCLSSICRLCFNDFLVPTVLSMINAADFARANFALQSKRCYKVWPGQSWREYGGKTVSQPNLLHSSSGLIGSSMRCESVSALSPRNTPWGYHQERHAPIWILDCISNLDGLIKNHPRPRVWAWKICLAVWSSRILGLTLFLGSSGLASRFRGKFDHVQASSVVWLFCAFG